MHTGVTSEQLESHNYWHGEPVRPGILRNTYLEVDFVLEKGDERAYAQVCYVLSDDAVIEREYRSLEAIRDSYPKMVVSMDDASFGVRNGIRHHLAWELLAGR
ncbi:MAG: ATP-binding protein [Lentisphaerae bacterium]|jgi:predicted AAA+ superfamily ATPase|nr:ATP-binding protein [Lentisphaerota bacterium]MBT4818944.1 ATP-binding protein [Lentisphaerota bacterium]MBT7054035.1 ATP-binding protein [Lentisphaerota bacterium]